MGVPKPHAGEDPLKPALCECEFVRPEQVERWLSDPAVRVLEDVRRRTRAGMGPCQAAICSLRLAARLVLDRGFDAVTATRAMRDFLETRWRGTRPVLWGSQLRQAQLNIAIQSELYNLDRHPSQGGAEDARPSQLAASTTDLARSRGSS
jgi:glycerol-3-phosphate dehydrogenase